MKAKRLQIGILVVLAVLLGMGLTERQTLKDWLKLRSYNAPATVASIADETSMTSKARKLFYVNKPAITKGKSFVENCPAGGEKTIVLGCYRGNDAGIFVYDVGDARLNGVEQVTSAHEMLHAAYRRLNTKERVRIDGLLNDYYLHQLKDERIKTVIEAYKISEPNDVVNEMHSIFATELANLPRPLEDYFRQYFVDRSKVVSLAQQYQSEFTNREEQVAAYDLQLQAIKQQIDVGEKQLGSSRSSLDAQAQKMEDLKNRGQLTAYNENVAQYNIAVNTYNALLNRTKISVDQYNNIVEARNKIALEEQELTRELLPSNLQN